MSYEEQLAGQLASLNLKDDERDELVEAFARVDQDRSKEIDVSELVALFKAANFPVARYQVTEYLQQYDLNRNGTITINEFGTMLKDLKAKKVAAIQPHKIVRVKETGMVRKGNMGAHHLINNGEVRAYSAFINSNLAHDEDLVNLGHLKLNVGDENDLFSKVRDGVLLCKMVNMASPGTIAEKAINKKKLEQVFRRQENLQLGIMSANSIGVVTVNHTPITWSSPEDNQHMVLGLIWQLVKKAAFKKINLNDAPNIAALLLPGETIDDLMGLSPEELLLRWMNYHLNKDKTNYDGGNVNNFGSDIKDSQAYISLLNRIQPLELHPQLDYSSQGISDEHSRAERVQEMAAALGCGDYITAGDITDGNEKVNMLFAAQLFNEHPGLEKPDVEQLVIEETLDEKTYRNWMNSLEVKPYVNYLYHSLSDGIVILQLEDIIRKGCVNWKMVNQPHTYKKLGGLMKKIENCNLAVKLAKDPCDCVVVGIDGSDICNMNKMLTLAIVWQLMRAYTMNVLAGGVTAGKSARQADEIIIKWANQTLADNDKTANFKNFSDQSLKNSTSILQLVESIKPGSVDWDCLENGNHLENARYCLSCCRRIGARVYALPEHIVDVNKKMVSTIFACLMGIGLSAGVASSGDGELATHRID